MAGGTLSIPENEEDATRRSRYKHVATSDRALRNEQIISMFVASEDIFPNAESSVGARTAFLDEYPKPHAVGETTVYFSFLWF